MPALVNGRGICYNFYMTENCFKNFATTPSNAKWEALTARKGELYPRADELRSPFTRDYTRIIHSMAYRRLKNKTQVFYNSENDHVCTRMEHVAYVESVSNTIAGYLGLNTELTRAIAYGHDLGHAPFGHHGERVINRICLEKLGETFWHEKNGLRLVDEVELLEDNFRKFRNLDLTYAVRDGIISHCGELDSNGLVPRKELIDLSAFSSAGMYEPATWEGCVVKAADKIAYIGSDIEDALALDFLDGDALKILSDMSACGDGEAVNTTVIMHGFILDVCRNSSPEKGIRMSAEAFERLTEVKKFNYENVCQHRRFKAFESYSELILNTLSDCLFSLYGGNVFKNIEREGEYYPELCSSFALWLARYCDKSAVPATLYGGKAKSLSERCENKKIYGGLDDEKTYFRAVIDFVSGMSDAFAVRLFNEQLRF